MKHIDQMSIVSVDLMNDPFEAFYLAHHHTVYKLVYRYVSSHADTENIVQDLFLELLSQFGQLPREQRLHWLYNKARNKRRSFIRGEQRRRQRDEAFVAAQSGIQGPTDFERRDLILRVLTMIPEDKADLLELCHLSGLQREDIAAVMGIQESSLPKLLARAERYFYNAYKDLHRGDERES